MKKLMFIVAAAMACLLVNTQESFSQNNNTVHNFVESLEVGQPVYHEGLTIIPIYNRAWNWSSNYTTLDEALDNGWLEISEMGDGSVPQVRLSNRSGRYIYIMGGEIITGCRQDRIVGKDVLIRPYRNDVIVPVYCVEQGRWQTQSSTFSSKGNLGVAKLRSYAQNSQGASQGNIWNEISNISKDLGVRSKTNAYQEVYESGEINRTVERYTRYLHSVPSMNQDTIGVLIGIGGKIASVDIFSNAQLFKKVWPKILRSSAVSTLVSGRGGSITQNDAAAFLRTLRDSRFFAKSAVDAGTEVSAMDQYMNANALILRGNVIHLAAFPQESGAYGTWRSYDSQINRPYREHRVPVTQ